MKMRARPQAQRKGKRSLKVAENVGGGERFVLIIMGEINSEKVGRCRGHSYRLMGGSMALLSSAQWHSGLVAKLNGVPARSSKCTVDEVCGSERRVC